jgi:hypothetical protein
MVRRRERDKPAKEDRGAYDECLGCGLMVEHEKNAQICPRCGGGSWQRRSMEDYYKKQRSRFKGQKKLRRKGLIFLSIFIASSCAKVDDVYRVDADTDIDGSADAYRVDGGAK